LTAIAELIAPSPRDVVLDVGCGDGFYLGNLARQFGFHPHGIDISIPAIHAAAGRYPECEWIVANADRFIPCSDRSFSVVMSITARMNPLEFRRILRDDGLLLVAIPAPDDLIEVRRAGRDRVARTIETFAHGFTLLTKRRTTSMAELDSVAVHDLLISIYRPMRSEPVKASRVVVTTDTPGYAAQVQVGSSATGPFTSVSASKTTTGRTVYALKPRRARYLVIWITSMPTEGVADVNEVGVTAVR
jgi:23S rRNA (guanine745-N1)-methyltransferase